MPNDPEVLGLLALMLLVESRRATRTSGGELVLLGDQDRGNWSRAMIAEGQSIVRQCLWLDRPGFYQLQAAINAVHSDAPSAEATDWRQILSLYDQLFTLTPTPIVALNRAVAVAEVHGASEALALVDALALEEYSVYHVVRADLLRRIGRREEAIAAYDAAMRQTENAVEREFLKRRRVVLWAE
jgi:RNA polymerase sigma-70 factor (ECF subfamily)